MLMRHLLLLLFCCLLTHVSIQDSAFAREAGWVPLKDNKASSLRVPIKSGASKTSTKSANKPASVNAPASASRKGATVYANQPPLTEKEVSAFMELLPRFRLWARRNGEEAHPIVAANGEPDFLYSPNAAQWVSSQNFDPPRFFCIMGRLAAGLVIVEEGNDFKGTRPADMPSVAPQELALVRRHLGELLTVGGPPQPLRAE